MSAERSARSASRAEGVDKVRALQRVLYRSAKQEIGLLRPGEAILYHEGNLATDVENDPTVAGRAAAFRDATEAARGRVAQRRLGFEWYQYIFWRSHRD